MSILADRDASGSGHSRLRSVHSMRSFFASAWTSSITVLFPAILWRNVSLHSISDSFNFDADSSEGVSFSGLLECRSLCDMLRTSTFESFMSLGSFSRTCLSKLFNRWRRWISGYVQILWQHLAVCFGVLTNGSELLVNHVISYPLCDCGHPQLFLRQFYQLISTRNPHVLSSQTQRQQYCSSMPASMSMSHATTLAPSPERNLISDLELPPGTRSCHQGTPHSSVVLTFHESLRCCLANLGGAFIGAIKNKHCHRGHICSGHQDIDSQLRISSEHMLIWADTMSSKKNVSG